MNRRRGAAAAKRERLRRRRIRSRRRRREALSARSLGLAAASRRIPDMAEALAAFRALARP